MASYEKAKEIRKTVFQGINKHSPKETWKKGIDYCTQKMAEIRAQNGYGFHDWRMCKDILCKEFGKLFVEKKEAISDAEDAEDAEIQRQVDISIGN